MSEPELPTDLPVGLYERLITRDLSLVLDALDPTRVAVERDALDGAESYETLARYVGAALGLALRSLPESDRPAQQVELCNQVLHLVNQRLAAAVEEGHNILSPPTNLLSITAHGGLPYDASRRPERPYVPLSTSDLLVNARGE